MGWDRLSLNHRAKQVQLLRRGVWTCSTICSERHAAPFSLALLVVWTAGTASFSLPPPKLPAQLAALFGKPPLTESEQSQLLADMLLNTKDEVIPGQTLGFKLFLSSTAGSDLGSIWVLERVLKPRFEQLF